MDRLGAGSRAGLNQAQPRVHSDRRPSTSSSKFVPVQFREYASCVAADVDYAVVRGEFAVAENGAVWCTQSALGPHRVLPFIAQHLAIVVSPGVLLHNLHEAYDRLAFDQPGFGLFISGPSKTADIEQSLVIGAHGARSLLVVLAG